MTPTNDRPPSWSPHNAAAFQLDDVVEHYHLRSPYPAAVFPFLLSLSVMAGGAIVELGCGTGEITRALAPHVKRIDAIDVSRQMIEKGRAMPGGDHVGIRWIEGAAEDAPLEGPYALAVAGKALHWMDWDVVLPRLARSLMPDAVLAIAVGPEAPPPWNAELRALTERYSAIQNWQNADLIGLLEGRGVFQRLGTKRFEAQPYQRTVEEYIDGLHATSGLARERMGVGNSRAFDDAVRALVAPHAVGRVLELAAGGEVTWGRPLSP